LSNEVEPFKWLYLFCVLLSNLHLMSHHTIFWEAQLHLQRNTLAIDKKMKNSEKNKQ